MSSRSVYRCKAQLGVAFAVVRDRDGEGDIVRGAARRAERLDEIAAPPPHGAEAGTPQLHGQMAPVSAEGTNVRE